MISFPPCKINLGLNVVSRRPDGYHNIETCFYPVQLTDILEIIPAQVSSFTSSGLPIAGNDSDNLCLRAFEILKREHPVSEVQIHLHKVIPMGAGLGGGSSDAAHMLRLLNIIFELGLTTIQLKSMALQAGSDCPFFIEDQPMLGSGRGELLEQSSCSLAGKFLVLVKPDVHIATVQAYAGVQPAQPKRTIQAIVEQLPLFQWKTVLQNDFEPSVFARFPVIREVKEKLYQLGAVYASMSGSGSAVYGIFNEPVNFNKHFAPMFYWGGPL